MRQVFSCKIAMLRNVARFDSMVGRIASRLPGLPGIGVLYGKEGNGKSFSARFSSKRHGACHVQVHSSWTRSFFLGRLAAELGLSARGAPPRNGIAGKIEEIAMHLASSRKILIVDGVDFLSQKGLVEALRDIYEASQGTIIIVGGEELPRLLRSVAGLSGHIFEQISAAPCDLDDCAAMAEIYCRGVELDRERLAGICAESEGCAARIALCLGRIKSEEPAHVENGQALYDNEVFCGDLPYSSVSTQLRARSTAFCQPL